MGTRGSPGFVSNTKLMLTYNHWDSYPEGLGVDMLGWARRNAHQGQVDALKKRLDELEVVEEIDEPTEEQKEVLISRGFGPTRVSNGRDFYSWLRDTQGDLDKILDSGFFMQNNDFVKDSLFCEWAYVIDLDGGKFEVYVGFQHGPGTGRFATGVFHQDDYAPVTLLREYDLSALPSDEVFLTEINALMEAPSDV